MNKYFALMLATLAFAARTHCASSEHPDPVTDQPLYEAVKRGQLKTVGELIRGGANVNAATERGFTPLHSAVYYGQVAIIRLLLRNGAHVDKQDGDGQTPLYWAAWNGRVEIVQPLLDAGANVNAQTKLGLTPLHSAADRGHVAIIRLLLRNGAGIDEQDTQERTPLHLALVSKSENRQAIARLLIDWLANVESLDSELQHKLTGVAPGALKKRQKLFRATRKLLLEKAGLPADLIQLITHEMLGLQNAAAAEEAKRRTERCLIM